MFEAHDVMDVKLRNDIAERRDVELVPCVRAHHRAAQCAGFAQQLRLIVLEQLVNFPYAAASRDDYAPGIMRVVHQQQPAQRAIAQNEGVGRQTRMKLEVHVAYSAVSLNFAPLVPHLLMTQTALIAGATGLIGRKLMEQLLGDERYAVVRVLTRRPLSVTHPKLEILLGDLDRLDRFGEELKADDVYCCLGTTMRQAGSKAAFEQVDYHLVVKLARAVHALGAKQFLVISSLSANARSPVYYSRVKGRMEKALREVGFRSLHILRPSLLLGARDELRLGEALAQRLMPLFSPLLRGRLTMYRPIRGEDVASAMRRLAEVAQEGAHVHTLPLASR